MPIMEKRIENCKIRILKEERKEGKNNSSDEITVRINGAGDNNIDTRVSVQPGKGERPAEAAQHDRQQRVQSFPRLRMLPRQQHNKALEEEWKSKKRKRTNGKRIHVHDIADLLNGCKTSVPGVFLYPSLGKGLARRPEQACQCPA